MPKRRLSALGLFSKHEILNDKRRSQTLCFVVSGWFLVILANSDHSSIISER